MSSTGNYSGLSPSFSAVLSSPDTYIVAESRPTFLVDPSAMPQPMLDVWVSHWLKSADPDSELSPEKRLRFSGQAMYELVPPLRDLAEDDDDVDEEYPPPRQTKAPLKTGPPRNSQKTGSSSQTRKKGPSQTAKKAGSSRDTKKAGSSRDKKTGSSRDTGKNAAGAQTPKSRQRPTQEVFVEIPPSQIDLTQYSRFQPPLPSATPKRATVSTSGHGATADIRTEPEDQEMTVGNPVPAGTPATPQRTRPRAVTPYTEPAPSPPHSSSDPMDIDSPIAAPIPRLPQRTQPSNTNALVLYSSDREGSLMGSEASNDSSGSVVAIGADGGNDSAKASSQDASNAGENEAAAPHPKVAVPPQEPSNDDAISDTAVPPGTSNVPSRPPKYAPPRRVAPEVRQGRQAQIAFRSPIQYEFKDSVTKDEMKERVAAWATGIGRHITNVSRHSFCSCLYFKAQFVVKFGRFMQDVTDAGLWATTHSDESLRSLAHLMEAAAVLEWYAVCKPLPEKSTINTVSFSFLTFLLSIQPDESSLQGRRQLSNPWTNVAQGSPLERLFTIIHSTADTVPLLSFLLSKEGGWSVSDMAHFNHGVIGSVSKALVDSVEPMENIFNSSIDSIPIGRALILLRQSRSLFKSTPDYNGPSEQLIDTITDATIFIFNGLALVRFLYHSIFAKVMSAGSAYGPTSPQGMLWQRYRECMLCLIENVAHALSSLRSDVSHDCGFWSGV